MLPLLPALILLLLHGPITGDRAFAQMGGDVQLSTLRMLVGNSNEQRLLSQLLEVSPNSALLHILRQRTGCSNVALEVKPVAASFVRPEVLQTNLWMKSAVHGRDGPSEA